MRKAVVTSAVMTVLVGLTIIGTAGTAGAVGPVKFVPFSHFGWKVDETNGGNVCTELSKDKCKKGEESEKAGGFVFPETVATAPGGDVYVGDNGDHRVQEFTENGEFVSMFGWNVNKAKLNEVGATQEEMNVCTAAEEAAAQAAHEEPACGAGEVGDGHSGEMLAGVQAITVDPDNRNVYVLDKGHHRVSEFTSSGAFILMIGGEVNQTKDGEVGATSEEKNVCTAASGDVCKAGVEGSANGAFKAAGFCANELAVGGPKDLLYVGDEGRVQEFEANGKWKDEVSLVALSATAKACSVAVTATGSVFVVDNGIAGVHEYNEKKELQTCSPDGASSTISGIALDAFERLGVIDLQPTAHVALYETTGSCKQVGEFTASSGAIPGGVKGLAFKAAKSLTNPLETPSDRAYVAEPVTQAVEIYVPIEFPSVETCAATGVAATTATLCGVINPNGVQSLGSFEYGPPPTRTPIVFEGEGFLPLEYHHDLGGLLPNQAYTFRAAVEAESEGKEQQAFGETLAFHTTTPPPEIPDVPTATFVKTQSAVLNARLNPEHALTEYVFEYGACPTTGPCPTLDELTEVNETETGDASEYGLLGVSLEARELSPGLTYRYRLLADNEHVEEREGKPVVEGGESESSEGTFTTPPSPVVQAQTGSASAITPTSATVSGVVNPDGQPASYRFLLGVDKGPATLYGVVFSGSVTATVGNVNESLALTGLQPGTTYAYKIAIAGGYGVAEGTPATFTTEGLPLVLAELPAPVQLAIPKTRFPAAKGPTPGQILAKALKACAKKPKAKRAACRKAAHKKYAAAISRKRRREQRVAGKGAHRQAT